MTKIRMTTEIFLKKLKDKHPELFDINDYQKTLFLGSKNKILVTCKEHGDFNIWPGDHLKGMSGCKPCIANKRKETNLKKYGVDNFFKRTDLVQAAHFEKHGVKNPGLLSDHLDKIKSTNIKKYGVEWANQRAESIVSRKKTNISRYGVEFPMQNPSIAKKAIETKISNGGFSKSNSSKEATNFILEYIDKNQYDIDQCAFACEELNLHEWGIYLNGKWMLYDLVVFEKGKRGDKNYIIEILEYHGPFHYTLDEVLLNGEDKAYPWKSNKTNIKESYEKDLEKEMIGKSLTKKYTIIRTRNHDNQGDL